MYLNRGFPPEVRLQEADETEEDTNNAEGAPIVYNGDDEEDVEESGEEDSTMARFEAEAAEAKRGARSFEGKES